MRNFKGVCFPIDVILICIRWYVDYSLSYRHIEEMIEKHFEKPVFSTCSAS